MNESPTPSRWRRYLCPTKDVLRAYTATKHGINVSLKSYDKEVVLTMQEAALIADRIREERQLIRHILGRKKSYRHMRQMTNVYVVQRDHLLRLAKQHGLFTDLLRERCKTYVGSATPGMNTITKRAEKTLPQSKK